MTSVPGSMDDGVNVQTGRQVQKRGLTTLLLGRFAVASGGTDLFLAGKKRVIVAGARLGVHSWARPVGPLGGVFGLPLAWLFGIVKSGGDVPKDAEDHQIYLEYYRDIGIPEAFYWFTLETSVREMHWMTPQEIVRFDAATQTIDKSALPIGTTGPNRQGHS